MAKSNVKNTAPVVTATVESTKDALGNLKYMAGNPKQYRADAKMGNFNINGKTLVGNTLIIHPIAWRFFEDTLFGRSKRAWTEIFFIDEMKCLSSIMFNGISLEELKKFNRELFYDDILLNDIMLEISWNKKAATIHDQSVTYYIAEFKQVGTVGEGVNDLIDEFAKSTRIYREDTLLDSVDVLTYHNYYFLPGDEINQIYEAEVVGEQKELVA